MLFDETPVDFVAADEAEVVAHGWGEIDAGLFVAGVARWGCAEDIGGVIGEEGAAIAPLCVNDALVVADGDPAVVADGFAVALEGLFEPGDDL